jgi:hypothetical protein
MFETSRAMLHTLHRCFQEWLGRDQEPVAPPPGTPTPQTLREMLGDVEAVTQSRFYEDPEPIASPVEMFLVRDGRPGEPFADLSAREKLQVLDDYTSWPLFQERGVTFGQVDQVFLNVINGKPRDQWLDGTGLRVGEPTAPDGRQRDRHDRGQER